MGETLLSTASALVLALSCCVLLAWRALTRSSHTKLPPGPGGLPLLGSVHKLPAKNQEKQFSEWAKQYGDVIYLKLFQTPTVILNSLEAATDVLTKRSAKHSDRPRMILLGELMNQGSSLPPMPYGERFRKHRRWMHEMVGTKERLEAHRDIQMREVHNLVKNLLREPERFTEHVHLYVAATMLEMTYGKRITSLDDDLVAVADRAIDGINEAGTPGAIIVDFFPILKSLPTWMPVAGFKRRALAVGEYVRAWKDTGYDMVTSAMAHGTTLPCVTATLLEEHGWNPTPEEAEDIKGLGCSVYGAGIESTRGTLVAFLLAMTRNPDVVRNAQDEIDSVVGNERLPDFADRPSLPYVDALLEELFRWNPPIPLAVPHRTMVDDEYRGYTIPEGCMVIPNVWAMSREASDYPEPEEFRPERFLSTSGKSGKLDIPLPSSYVFGFGRRVCPGQAFADATAWLAIVRILAVFDIRKPLDPNGEEKTPPAAFFSGFTSQPMPFECRIVPRSEKVARMAISA
ncbi:cytochrome P450 [Cubamyces sp. BRFM 1775]|nr:cytochrome P450 [Cubamyces sp. BRFM 1775]